MARSNAVGKLREIAEAQGDQRDVLLRAVGDVSKNIVLHSQVLVATRAGSKYHPGTAILRTDRDMQEQQFQGSIGLVIQVGPGAFIDAPGASFHGMKVNVGDWVLYKPADGLQLFIREVPCRLFEDVSIKMIVDDPEIFW